MPKSQLPPFDPLSLPESNGTTYPEPFASLQRKRFNRRLGDHAGLTNFGVVMTRIAPGGQSSCRHAHLKQDEFVYVLEGELTLVEDGGESVLRAGECAAFPKNSGNGHHLINRSGATAVYLEIGARAPADITVCSDIDMMSSNADGRFVHKDGTPYPDRR